MRILVIEDDIERALALSQLLTDAGHQTSNLFTVRGMGRGSVAGNDINEVDAILDLANFDCAFVDGVLGDKSRKHGWDVIPYIAHRGVVCIAMSRESAFNDRMTEAGAQFAVLKENLWKEYARLLEEATKTLADIRRE